MMDFEELKRNLISFRGPQKGDLATELSRAKGLNLVIKSFLTSLESAEQDVEAILESTQNANFLLDKWAEILSQAEHTQKLLSDELWEGLTRDNDLITERQQERARLEQQKLIRDQEERAAAEVRAKERAKKESAQELARSRLYGHRRPPSSSATTSRVTRAQNRATGPGTAPSSRQYSTTSTANKNTIRKRH